MVLQIFSSLGSPFSLSSEPFRCPRTQTSSWLTQRPAQVVHAQNAPYGHRLYEATLYGSHQGHWPHTVSLIRRSAVRCVWCWDTQDNTRVCLPSENTEVLSENYFLSVINALVTQICSIDTLPATIRLRWFIVQLLSSCRYTQLDPVYLFNRFLGNKEKKKRNFCSWWRHKNHQIHRSAPPKSFPTHPHVTSERALFWLKSDRLCYAGKSKRKKSKENARRPSSLEEKADV